MIQIRNKFIPFKGYKAIALWPFIFIRKTARITDVDINHESIHGAQQKEMLVIFFYLWYSIEYLVRLFQKGNAYRNISFEREAYTNEGNLNYLSTRRPYSWWKFLRRKQS